VSKLPPGLYDLPITNEIERELQQLDRVQLAVDKRRLLRAGTKVETHPGKVLGVPLRYRGGFQGRLGGRS